MALNMRIPSSTGLRAGSANLLTPKPFTLVRPIARNVVVAASKQQPSWKLDKPNRLWELDTIWYPGGDAPEYLDGSLPGDRGFDPLRLFANPSIRPWLVEGELYNGRVAMMAAAGILFTEAVGLGPWWTAPAGGVYPLPFATGVVVSHAIMAVFEYKRITNFQKYGETGFLNSVPFDPLGLRSDKTRQNEVRNGRLAMLANLGFWSQAANTGKGPLENLRDHIADPTHNNIYTSKVGFEATLAAIFIGIVPIVIEVRKDLTPKDRLNDEGIRPFPFL